METKYNSKMFISSIVLTASIEVYSSNFNNSYKKLAAQFRSLLSYFIVKSKVVITGGYMWTSKYDDDNWSQTKPQEGIPVEC